MDKRVALLSLAGLTHLRELGAFFERTDAAAEKITGHARRLLRTAPPALATANKAKAGEFSAATPASDDEGRKEIVALARALAAYLSSTGFAPEAAGKVAWEMAKKIRADAEKKGGGR